MTITYELSIWPERSFKAIDGMAGVYTNLHWKLTAASDDAVPLFASDEQRIELPKPRADKFVAVAQMTPDAKAVKFVAWLDKYYGEGWLDKIKAGLVAQIEEQKIPPLVKETAVVVEV